MFKSNQPRISIKKSSLELNFDIISGFFVFLQFFIVAQYWSKLPDIIPSHFNSSGEPNAWGGKISILILPATSLLLYIFITFIAGFPHIFNYLWKINEENAENQYRLAKNFLTFIKTFILLVFTVLTWVIIEAAKGSFFKSLNFFILLM